MSKKIPIYTQGDDIRTKDGVKHLVTATKGSSSSTTEPVIHAHLLYMGEKLGDFLKAWHEKHNGIREG